MVDLQVGNQTIPFLVDTGATHSVITVRPPGMQPQPGGPSRNVIDASGGVTKVPFLPKVKVKVGSKNLDHEFLFIEKCPASLLGRDLLMKLGAKLEFSPEGCHLALGTTEAAAFLLTLKNPKSDLTTPDSLLSQAISRVVPWVWADGTPGRAKRAEPVVVELKPGCQAVRVRQYPLKQDTKIGLQKVVKSLFEAGLIAPCQSEYNTPIMGVPKKDGKYRLVQDLRFVNEVTRDITPVVPNPYTLVTLIPGTHAFFSCLDLKDAFFTIPLHPSSYPIFAFTWEDPPGTPGIPSGQYSWRVLPQGYKNAPTLFGEALCKILRFWVPKIPCRVIQYVDDLLVSATSQNECLGATIDLLNFLGYEGFKVSQNKAQIAREEVSYLGFLISKGQRRLTQDRISTICAVPLPTTRRAWRTFLGMAGFCKLWIPNFSVLARPLFDALKGAGERVEDTAVMRKAFKEIKQRLLSAPALGLPDPEKPFELFVHERQGMALGVLTQQVGSWRRPVAYLSKLLDNVTKGWPSCLRAVAATVLLAKEAQKFSLGAPVTIHVPHAVTTVLEQKGGLWLSNARISKYQAQLLDNPDLRLVTSSCLNPATLLPTPASISDNQSPIFHDCIQTIETEYSSRRDLSDTPLPHPHVEFFVDGSSMVRNGIRMAGYAVVTDNEVVEARPLPPGTSAQKAELIALTRALELAYKRKVNIFTDSRYAFGVLHAFAGLWRNRGYKTAEGEDIKHLHEVQDLLGAVQLPYKAAIMQIKGHGKEEDARVREGNRLADEMARRTVKTSLPTATVAPVLPARVVPLPQPPQYSNRERREVVEKGGKLVKKGGSILRMGRLVCLEP